MSKDSKGDGLEDRYVVAKMHDPEGKHDACRYFVLDPQHDPIAHYALGVYADRARAAGHEVLAKDLYAWRDHLTLAEPEGDEEGGR